MNNIMYLLFIVCIFQSTHSYCDTTSIYADDGKVEREIIHGMSKEEQQELEMNILDLFDIDVKPTMVHGFLEGSAPQFLLKIYHQLRNKETGKSLFRRSTEYSYSENSLIEESDTIMTLEIFKNDRGKNYITLFFNLSNIPVDKDILAAELRVYKKKTIKKHGNQGLRIIAKQKIEDKLYVVTELFTTTEYKGWIKFNITNTVMSWTVFPEINLGVYLFYEKIDPSDREIHPNKIGLVTSKRNKQLQPFLVVYFKDGSHFTARKKSSNTLRIEKMYFPKEDDEEFDVSGPCQIRKWFINFKDLGWDSWIIAPDGYDAYYCAGKCSLTASHNSDITNHAIILNLMHLHDPTKYPQAVCAAKELGPQMLLYYKSERDTVMNKHEDMVVKSCACQ